ncbi:MAG: hypothetical protein JWO67_5850 [Streptosporangiaceae bacterium]|nr:hypothetical protein [Streptosporangiaceae bacterium]
MSAARRTARVHGRRSSAEVLEGIAAVAALAALVAGVPFALLTFFGSPVPEQWPTLNTLTQRLGPSSLITILVVLVWLAWIQLSLCVIVEVYAGVRGVGVPARVPLAGGTQSMVHRLVVTALLLFTATTAIMPAFSGRDLHAARPVQTQSQELHRIPAVPEAGTPAEPAESVQSPPVQKSKATKIYHVHPPHGRHHESLWEIADKCLGDGRRYPEIYALNKGREQPDGSRLTIASLIRPGWILEMPDDAVGAEVVPVHDLGEHRPHGTPKPAPHKLAEPPPHAAQAPGHQAQPAPRHQIPQQRAPQGAQAPARGQDTAATTPSAGGYEFGWPEGLSVASLLAAGLLAALGRRRREQMWHRAFGQMIAAPEGDAAVAEQALRIGADTEGTRLLDLGLRQMSKALAADGRTPPTVYGVHLGAETLDLWIAPADRNPLPPWEAHDNGQVWRLRRDWVREIPLDPDGLRDVLAPYPGLISLGTNHKGRILVDLEAAHGLIALRGPEDARRAVLAAVATELATNRWSDHMRITLVGFGEELSQIAPDRIRAVRSLGEALPELEARAEEVRQALAASGADSVLTGRCRGVFGEAWMPHYLVMADEPTDKETDRLIALARTGRRMAAGYIVPGDVQGATWTWEVTAAGRLQAGVLGFEVEAQLVPEPHYRAVVELFRTAGRVEGVPLPGLEDDPASAAMDIDLKPVVDLRLLGPIEVDAPGPMEDARRALCTEVLVYLATHPGGVHPTVLSGAVWPRGATAGVRDATIARVSDWLGRDSRGRPNLYYDEAGRIKLGSEVRVDWSVLRWLVWRSAAEPASETAYMSYALDLVRGPLLAGRPRGRYGWLAVDGLEYEAVARVIDIAHRLVVLRLDDGDARGAIAAARAGLRLAREDEGLWRDLLRATHAAGDPEPLRDAVEELRLRVERGPMLGQMQPETEALIEELLPQYRRVAI